MPITESFQNLSGRRQLMAAGGLLLILCLVFLAVYFAYLRPNYGILFSKLRPADAAAIVGELDHRKIPYRLADSGATILVPDAVVDTTRLAVMSEDLPIKGVTGFEIFNKSDMGLTEFAQKINYQRALQGELARTIMSLEGVETARVHLSLTEPTVFRADRIAPKASVTVTSHIGVVMGAAEVRGIQRLVASSVPELDVADVAVLDEHGRIVSGDLPLQSTPGSAFAQEKQAIEAYHTARIREALEHSYSRDVIGVSVGIEMAAPGPGSTAQTAPIFVGEGRNQRLMITLSPRKSLSDSARDDVRSIAGNAVGFDPTIGDVIIFGIPSPSPLPETLATPALSDTPALASNTQVREIILLPDRSSLWAAIAAAIVFVGGLVVWRRRVSSDRARRRQSYAEQLSALLEQGGPDVTRRN